MKNTGFMRLKSPIGIHYNKLKTVLTKEISHDTSEHWKRSYKILKGDVNKLKGSRIENGTGLLNGNTESYSKTA